MICKPAPFCETLYAMVTVVYYSHVWKVCVSLDAPMLNSFYCNPGKKKVAPLFQNEFSDVSSDYSFPEIFWNTHGKQGVFHHYDTTDVFLEHDLNQMSSDKDYIAILLSQLMRV